jgi:nicotinate-nucleotide adenylyltransferase
MTHQKQPIGILGGTFDPIHFGHLRTALEIYQSLHLSHVKIIPCFQPVHRKLPTATPEQRLAMVKLATESEPALKVDNCEIKRKTPSYMIDTLEYLLKSTTHPPLCLIMGIDAFLGFPSWHRYEDILRVAHLIIVHRPNYQLPSTGILAELLKQCLTKNPNDLHEHSVGKILFHPVTPLEISASDIRRQIATGKVPRYLLPDNVYQYIQQHGIYSVNRL